MRISDWSSDVCSSDLSDQPNLHNIPVRSELGREFRKAFVPAPGFKLLVADYNQIELRCIAHLAEDPGLIESFESRRDIHTETAARNFGVEPADVTIRSEERRVGKECVRTRRSRCAHDLSKKKKAHI